MKFIYKNLCIYSYTVKLQLPSKYSPFDIIHLSRCFSHCSKQLLNSWIFMPFSASAVPCFTSSTSAKHFPLRTFFTRETKTKSYSGWDQVNREGGTRGSCHFGKKLLNTQFCVGRCTHKSPIMKWANVLKESSKITEAKCSLSQQCQLGHYYRWVPGTFT